MKCKDLEELLSEYADNELTPEQRELVEKHLPGCAACRTTLANFKTIGEQFRLLKTMPAMPDTKEATLQKIRMVSTKKQTLKWVRPSLTAIPLAAIMITLFVIQPWSPASSSTTVLAMEQLITQVENSPSLDQLKSCRVITYESAAIDSNGNIQNLGDRYEVEFTLSGHHLQIVSAQNEVTNEFIFLDGGGIQYYRDSNSISMDYQTAIFKYGGGGMPTKSRTLTILKNNVQVLQSPDELIDGVVCLHYRGVNTNNELWVGRDDYMLRQIIWQTPEQVNTEYVSIIKYYDFNTPITIQPPLDESGNLLPGWQAPEKPPFTLTVAPSVTITLTSVTMPYEIVIKLTKEWILANDKCPNPYFALVTFPTAWLSDSPITGPDGIILFVGSIYPPTTLQDLHIEPVPLDIDSFIENSTTYSDSGDVTGVKMLRWTLTIKGEETTMFFNFVDPGVLAPDMLNRDGSKIEGLKLP